MPDKQIVAFLLALSMLGAVVSSTPLKNVFDNIHLSLSENEKTVTVKASYPKADSKRVHEFVRQHLHLTDLPDLSGVELSGYTTPDGFLSMYFKSKNGYLKIVMEKEKNTAQAYEQMKSTVKGIQRIVAEN